MENFNDYIVAKISPETESNIKNLEHNIKADDGKEIILIAYEHKSSCES